LRLRKKTPPPPPPPPPPPHPLRLLPKLIYVISRIGFYVALDHTSVCIRSHRTTLTYRPCARLALVSLPRFLSCFFTERSPKLVIFTIDGRRRPGLTDLIIPAPPPTSQWNLKFAFPEVFHFRPDSAVMISRTALFWSHPHDSRVQIQAYTLQLKVINDARRQLGSCRTMWIANERHPAERS